MTKEQRPPAAAPVKDRERLAALGQVAGELIHDVANVVATLRARAALALSDAREGRLPIAELEHVVESTNEMGAMLRDVLDTLKDQTASPEMVFDPEATVDQVLRRFVATAPRLGVRLDRDLPPGTVLRGRASFLARAVANLLANAARHARAEVRVSLSLEDGERRLRVAVEDDGPGIPPENASTVFKPLVRGEEGETGLGLSSVLWSVAHLGGEVGCVPGAELGGACFEIHLPMADSGQTAMPAGPGSLAGCRIVLVEDDAVVRGALVRLLDQLGAEPIALHPAGKNDEELLHEILRAMPDAILMDLKLGRHRGAAVWEMLKSDVPGLAGQVIFLSGLGAGDPDWEAARASGRPILSKPVDLAELVRVVKRQIGQESTAQP